MSREIACSGGRVSDLRPPGRVGPEPELLLECGLGGFPHARGVEHFASQCVESRLQIGEHGFRVPRGKAPAGKIVIKDRIADNMLQQLLTRTEDYDVIATLNLNGDYMSDAAAAQVGGLGMAPGGNIGDGVALFEATHGTAPKYAGKDMVNPASLILSGVMMLEYMGWDEAADLIVDAMTKTIQNKTVTYDLHRQIEGATKLSTSQFAEAIVANMNGR